MLRGLSVSATLAEPAWFPPVPFSAEWAERCREQAIMRRADGVFAVICMGLSAWLILESRKFDYTTAFTPGPGFHPFWLGVILGVLSICLMWNTIRKKQTPDAEKKGPLEGRAAVRAGSILLITAGLAFFMTSIGFVLASFLFVVLILKAMEQYSLFKSLMYGALLSATIFLVFRYWLNVGLPGGWLGL